MSIFKQLFKNGRAVMMQQLGETPGGIIHRTSDGRISTNVAAIVGEVRTESMDLDGTRQNVRLRIVEIPSDPTENGIKSIRREDLIIIENEEWRVVSEQESIPGMHAVLVMRPERIARGGRGYFQT